MTVFKSFAWGLALLLADYAAIAGEATPEAAVKEYLAAIRTEGMLSVSRFIHPDELKRFKDMVMPLFRKDANDKSEAIHRLFGEQSSLASVEAVQIRKVIVVSTRRAGGEWKLMLSGELEGLANALCAQP